MPHAASSMLRPRSGELSRTEEVELPRVQAWPVLVARIEHDVVEPDVLHERVADRAEHHVEADPSVPVGGIRLDQVRVRVGDADPIAAATGDRVAWMRLLSLDDFTSIPVFPLLSDTFP